MNLLQKIRQLNKKWIGFSVQTLSDYRHSKFFEQECIQRLAELVQSTGTFDEAFRLLVSLYPHVQVSGRFSQCLEQMRAGIPFSETLRRNFPHISLITIEMIHVGEINGALPRVLVLLSEYIQEKKKVSATLMTACLYPIILLVVMTVIIGFLVVYIFPKMLAVMQGMNVQLPLMTRILIWVVSFLQNYWFFLAASMVIMSVCFSLMLKNQRTREKCEHLVRKVGSIKKFSQLVNTILVFRVLAVFLETDPRIVRAVTTASMVVRTSTYRKGLVATAEKITAGQSFSNSLYEIRDYFTRESYEFILIGERGGRLAYMCNRIAISATDTLTKKIHTMLKLAEPLLMLVMGGIVTTIALSFMLPLYSITGTLGK